MDVTNEHITTINQWISDQLENHEAHFLHDLMGQWMLYGTNDAQLAYLGLTNAFSELYLEFEANRSSKTTLSRDDIARHAGLAKGHKELYPNVSNFWVEIKHRNIRFERTGDKTHPVRITAVPQTFGTKESEGFFERFNASFLSMNNLTYQKIATGIDKAEEGARYSNPEKDRDTRGNLKQYAVRRACKYLIYEAIGAGCSIRYVLDDLNLRLVAEKARVEGKVPVCTSELREIFRYWDSLGGSVLFYKEFLRVPPPWESPTGTPGEIEAWSDYARHRAEKLLGSGIQSAKLTSCVQDHGRRAFPEAIRDYHEAMPSMYRSVGTGASTINSVSTEMETN